MALTLRTGYEIGEQLCDDPVIWIVDDFVTDVERNHIVEFAGHRMEDAKVSRRGANRPSEKRTGSVAWVKHDETPIVRGLVKRVGDLVGVAPRHAESLQVVHYAETQEYRPHYDAWDIHTDKGREKTAVGGNRAITALMYLNRVAGGGGTGFPNLDLEVEAIPGRLCIFHDLIVGESERHPDSLHGGLPVTAGEKWACNLWFRAEPYTRPGKSRGMSHTARRPNPAAKKNRKAQKAARRRNR